MTAMGEPAATGEWLRTGFELIRGLMPTPCVERLRADMANIYEKEGEKRLREATRLLELESVRAVVEHPALQREVERACKDRGQLLKLEAGIGSLIADPPRSWHRDLSVSETSGSPLSVSAILYLDQISDMSGPTFSLPLTGRGDRPVDLAAPDPRETPIYAGPGDALLIAAHAWHSGSSRREPAASRRTLVIQYGFWWMKQQFDPRALKADLDLDRRRLYGLDAPPGDLYIADC